MSKASGLLPRILVSFGLVFILCGHALHVWQIPFVAVLENYFYDARLRAFMPETVDERVVIVDIDEPSLARVGRWPWPRDKVARLLTALVDEQGAAVVGFDVIFAEAEERAGLAELERLARREWQDDAAFRSIVGKLRARLDYDRQLVEAIRGRPVVLGYYFSNYAEAHQGGVLPPPSFSGAEMAPWRGQVLSWSGYGANLATFQAAALAAGHINPVPDSDGRIRRVPLLVEFGGNHYEALSLAVLRTFVGGKLTVEAPADGGNIEWLRVANGQRQWRIPVDGELAALVPYRSADSGFRYISAADVLEQRLKPRELAGRIVLIGTTAPGLNDLRTTPVGASYPGVEVHASMISGMLDVAVKEKPDYLAAADMLGILAAGGLLAVALPFLSPALGMLLAVGILASGLGLNLYMWSAGNVALPFAAATLCIVLVYGLNAAWGFYAESRVKREFTRLFGQYVPPELVAEMARDPQRYSMVGRHGELTVLFADIRGFTAIAEGLPPAELTQLINEYLGCMTEIVRRHHGTLDKYIGDAIMAFWGAPLADERHALHAVQAALDMQRALPALNERFRRRGWPELHIGIGVNGGQMIVGDMGSAVRKSYTVMGDAVNLAARLEGLTKAYEAGILVGEATQRACPELCFREIDRVRVKGKAQAVTVFQPLGRTDELDEAVRRGLADWHAALALYRAQRWSEAEAAMRRLPATEARLQARYLERIARRRDEPAAHMGEAATSVE